MKPEVSGALYEWLSGLLVGFIPLIGHALMSGVMARGQAVEGDWAVDVIFVAITTSGTSVVSILLRIAKGTLSLQHFGLGTCLQATLSLLFLISAAMVYGALASGHAGATTIDYAWFFLACSCIASLYFEMALARKIALSRASPAREGIQN